VGFRIGQNVTHPKFGAGVIVDAEGDGGDARVQVNFGPPGRQMAGGGGCANWQRPDLPLKDKNQVGRTAAGARHPEEYWCARCRKSAY
jgi:hypothetical protein